MEKDCPKCKGTGSIVVDYKECDTCSGTGYIDSINLGNHFKGVNSNAKAKFDLDSEEDIPCEVCKGKGQIEVYENCSRCNGSGKINVCKKCGKEIVKSDYCEDCLKILEEEKMKKEAELKREKENNIVYTLDPLCEMSDLEVNSYYKGKITKVTNFGVFVSLNKQVWGLMRTGNPNYNVGEEIIVKVIEIKTKKHEVDMSSVSFKNYTLKRLKKEIKRTEIGSINDNTIGKTIKIQGKVNQIQQTAGPTIFTIIDDTDITWVAAFSEAGKRAYPEIEVDDLVEVQGEVNQHSGQIQIESETIEKLEDKQKEHILDLIEKALDAKAEPEDNPFMVKSVVLNDLKSKMRKSAKTIRRAILDGRTILLRHHADADGICAGVAMEKAIIPLVEKINPNNDAKYHYFKRSPSKAPFYELEDLVKDLSFALEDLDRHGQKLPLIVLLDNGSTDEDIIALMQAKIYDIEILVIDHHSPGEVIDGKVNVDEYVDTHVNPYLVGGDSQLTAGALASEVACIINPEIRETIEHLPAVAALGDHAECGEVYQYLELAENKGYNRDYLKKIADCVDFEAYYLRFMNGRGIIDTILGVDNIDKHRPMVDELYKVYEKRVNTQLKAVLPNIKETQLDNGVYLNIVDVEKYAHKFTFPAPGKTCGFVHDKIVEKLGEDKSIITLGHGPDFGVFRATDKVNEEFGFNVNEVVKYLAERIPSAGIDGGGHECAGSVKYIEGLSRDVLGELANYLKNMKSSNI